MLLLLFVSLALASFIFEALMTVKIYQKQKQFCKNFKINTSQLPSLTFCIVKRLADVLVSFLVCITVLPILYVVFAPLIKLTSKGPVIFKQERIGFLNKHFICYKFRSMYLNNDNIAAGPNDKRVTKIGRLMRKTHIDEFPQFFNVLIGDMSIVGPRPSTPFAALKLQKSQRYMERLLIKPGITGLAQINSNRTLEHNQIMFFDLTYLEKMSCKKDLFIIFETLKFKDIAY